MQFRQIPTRGSHGENRCIKQFTAGGGRGTYMKIKSLGGVNMWKLNQTLRGPFSAVSKPNFASKYSLESSWRDLQDLHAFAPLRPQYFSKFSSNFLAFSKLDMLKSSIFSNFVVIFADFHEIWSDFLRFSWETLQLLEISRFQFNFSVIIPDIHLIFDLIFDLILFNFI